MPPWAGCQCGLFQGSSVAAILANSVSRVKRLSAMTARTLVAPPNRKCRREVEPKGDEAGAICAQRLAVQIHLGDLPHGLELEIHSPVLESLPASVNDLRYQVRPDHWLVSPNVVGDRPIIEGVGVVESVRQ